MFIQTDYWITVVRRAKGIFSSNLEKFGVLLLKKLVRIKVDLSVTLFYHAKPLSRDSAGAYVSRKLLVCTGLLQAN